MSKSWLSIVVIGRNEGVRLVRCLQSIRAVCPPTNGTELIYVDSGSHDDSPERAAEYATKVIRLADGKLSAARARNDGWRAATSPLIFFVDGDTVLDPLFIDRARIVFEDSSVVAACGHLREIQPEASIYQRVLDLEWIVTPGLTDSCGGNAMMRRRALEQVNGFDPGLIAGEEPDLCRRMRATGGLILHMDVPMMKHDLAITRFNQYWRHAVRAGHAYAEVASRYQSSADPLWSRESRRNLLRGPLLLLGLAACALTARALHPWNGILLFVLIAVTLVMRTAWLARWRSRSWKTLLLFAVHSHFQQLPIFCGQMSYRWARLRRKEQGLIEYKEVL